MRKQYKWVNTSTSHLKVKKSGPNVKDQLVVGTSIYGALIYIELDG